MAEVMVFGSEGGDDSGMVSEEAAAAELSGATPEPKADEAEGEESAAPAPTEETAAEELEKGEALGAADEMTAQARLQDLIKQRGGVKKFVDGLFEGWNSTARLHKDVESLRGELREALAAKSEPPPPPPPSEEAQLIARQMEAQDKRAAEVVARQEKILNEAEDIRFKLAEKRGELRHADDYEKQGIADEIRRMEGQIQGLRQEYKSNEDRLEVIGDRKTELESKRRTAEREHQAFIEQQKLREAERVEYQKGVVTEFLGSLTSEAAALGIPTGSKAIAHMEKTIRAQITHHLRSLPPDSPPIDIPAFVKQAAAEYAEVMGVTNRGKLQQLAREKQGVQGVRPATAPSPSTAQATSTEPKKRMTATDWSARAAKLLG